MLRLYVRVKFRAFGVTLKTIEREADATPMVLGALRGLKGINPAVTRIIAAHDTWGITGEYIQMDSPLTIMDDRGVLVQLR